MTKNSFIVDYVCILTAMALLKFSRQIYQSENNFIGEFFESAPERIKNLSFYLFWPAI